MSKARFEAFSDGIFAVAATLLVLDLKSLDLGHAVTAAAAVDALLALWRPLLGYVDSFLVVGIVWINHHTLFHAIERIDRVTVVLNLLLLLLVALVPFPTALLGTYAGLQPVVTTYGLLLGTIGLVFAALSAYVRRRYRVARRVGADPARVRRSNLRGAIWPLGYFGAAALSLANGPASIALYTAIPLLFLFPSPVERELERRARREEAG